MGMVKNKAKQQEQKMFDIYVYSSDSVGGPVRIVPDQTEYKARAQLFAQAGFNVKVVDQFDGVVVYTLDAMPQ